jgi:glutamate 5-kinase
MAGIALAILNGTHERPIGRALEQERGTLFLPVRKTGARKAWIGGRMKTRGTLSIDDGAARALGEGGSLLATGITAVDGSFARGDLVAVVDAAGALLAHGLSEYDAVECAALKGHRSSQHEAILGYAPRPAVVHRDQMVLK